jgi:3',5'-cyclic AMP phosphodiesterase CpdA
MDEGGVVDVVQITDTHIVEPGQLCMGEIDTATFLRAAVATVVGLKQRPGAVIVTGDLVNEGRLAQYAQLRHLLAPLPAPVYLLPGNHDDRTAMRMAFPDHQELGSGPTCDYAVMVGGLRLIGLDTSVPGAPGGSLSDAQLGWLDACLGAAPSTPTLVAMHHPPFATGIEHMDEMGLAASAVSGLAEVIERHHQVERITCGHLHRAISTRFAGTVAATTPSACHAVALELRPAVPGAYTYEPPAITVHHWDGAHLVTHQQTIGDYAPHPFE